MAMMFFYIRTLCIKVIIDTFDVLLHKDVIIDGLVVVIENRLCMKAVIDGSDG